MVSMCALEDWSVLISRRRQCLVLVSAVSQGLMVQRGQGAPSDYSANLECLVVSLSQVSRQGALAYPSCQRFAEGALADVLIFTLRLAEGAFEDASCRLLAQDALTGLVYGE